MGKVEKELEKLKPRLERATEALELGLDGVQEKINAALGEAEDLVCEYNEAVADIRAVVKLQADSLRDDWDEKSEKWQEGETGQEKLEEVEQWEQLADALDAELEAPTLPDIELEGDADALDKLKEVMS
jgi:hypothetical protein